MLDAGTLNCGEQHMLDAECAAKLFSRVKTVADTALCPECRGAVTRWEYHRSFSQVVQLVTKEEKKRPDHTVLGVSQEEGKVTSDNIAIHIPPQNPGVAAEMVAQRRKIALAKAVCAVPTFLLIAGGIMYGTCEGDESEGCPQVETAGVIMMSVGGSLMACACTCSCLALCALGIVSR